MDSKSAADESVRAGVDVLLAERLETIAGRVCGLVTNAGAMTRAGVRTFEALASHPTIPLRAIFSPEHGITGAGAGDLKTVRVQDESIPVHDLYGETRRPSPEQIQGLDALLFDLQGLGLRFYTYDSTLYYVMQAASEAKIPVLVLDRPEPMGGMVFEGPPLKPRWRSFVGIADVPARHGMTMGELSRYFNRHHMRDEVRLDVISCAGWHRGMTLDETGLPWAPPSPAIRTWHTMLCYPTTCFLEGTNVSEGRGTDTPFERFGAPWIDGAALAMELTGLDLPGVRFREAQFTPTSSKWKGEVCHGCQIDVLDSQSYRPIEVSVWILWTLHRLWPEDFAWLKNDFIDLLYGSDELRTGLDAGLNAEAIIASWSRFLRGFQPRRHACLLPEYGDSDGP